MARRGLRGWLLAIALCGVLVPTRGEPAGSGDPAAVSAAATPVGRAILVGADGRRSGIVGVGVPTVAALVLDMPPDWAGQRIEVTVWRRLPSGREATPWITCTPKVRADATVPIAGLRAGSYDVEVGRATARGTERHAATAVPMPGRVALGAPASPVR